MTKQLVTGMAGDPDYGTNKQGEKKKKIRETCAKEMIHHIPGFSQ